MSSAPAKAGGLQEGSGPGGGHLEDDPAYQRYTPRWIMASSLVLCLVGLGIDVYLTYEHYWGGNELSCPDKGFINCLKVTTSVYSKLAGIPVADLGVAFFVGMTVLCSPWAWRAAGVRIHQLRTVGVSVSMLMVLYLVWAELIKIKNICLYCTATHVIAFLLFLLVLTADAIDRDA